MSEPKVEQPAFSMDELGRTVPEKVESHVTTFEDDEDRNPRNWSPTKRRLMFIALMSSSILADGYVLNSLRLRDTHYLLTTFAVE